MYTAIFGGTFNPLHIGHYQILEALQKDERIDEILIMPDKIPPHKICDFMAKESVRIEMCRIAAKDFSKAEVCLIEFERNGKSYSYDTVLRLKKGNPQKNFIFVCGGDMLVTLHEWYNYKELIKIIPFMAFRRYETADILFDKRLVALKKEGAEIIVNDARIQNVSSSEIRLDFKNSRKLLPIKIYEFLNELEAYRE